MHLKELARTYAALGDEHRLLIVESLRFADRTTTELADISGLAGNLLAHHLNVLEKSGLVFRRTSEGDKRRRYVVLRHEALGELMPPTSVRAEGVLFVCTHNSARSQFAAALWQQRTGAETQSAGREPAVRVHPHAVKAAAELGVDISAATPHGYDDIAGTPDLVISVCDRAREGKLELESPRLHWSVPDPVRGGRLTDFRRSFSIIKERIDRITTDKETS